MHPLVGQKSRAVTERLPTQQAFVASVFLVGFAMDQELVDHPEAGRAVRAGVQLLCVSLLVGYEVRLVAESPVTLGTNVGLFSRVGPLMGREV